MPETRRWRKAQGTAPNAVNRDKHMDFNMLIFEDHSQIDERHPNKADCRAA
jgi:hypothetical protein